MAAQKQGARWWAKQTEEWEAVRGEVSAREFAESRGFNPQTFSWWRHELRRRDRERGGSLIPVEVVEENPEAKMTSSGFSERWLEAELPDGLKFRFSEGTGVEYVAGLLKSMRRGGRC